MANSTLVATGTPEGFDELASARTALVDVYFGDKKVGETLAVTKPGSLQFQTPSEVLQMLPLAVAGPELRSGLSTELPSNAALACSRSSSALCGVLEPDVVGIIYDEDRFRVSVFVNPRFLSVNRIGQEGYLPTPDGALSLTNAVGFNASGTIGEQNFYNLQNRTIIGLGSARIRANTSVASKLGLDLTRATAAVDTMSGADLEKAADAAQQVNHQLVGGASTVVISTTTIIIILLLVIILIIAVK